MVYITGDTHGKFDKIKRFCNRLKTSKDDTMIILGDAGINYYLNIRDDKLKQDLSKLPITLFMIHGNHECRTSNIESYTLSEYWGGKVYVEPNYPNLVFAIDGELYNIPDNVDNSLTHKTLVIGGAYSVDKFYRIIRGMQWFSDEQPDSETKEKVENTLGSLDWNVDVILSHTCPVSIEPKEWFLPNIDQSEVDKSTEEWLQSILDRLKHFDKWYIGHYHGDKHIEKFTFMFNNIEEFMMYSGG